MPAKLSAREAREIVEKLLSGKAVQASLRNKAFSAPRSDALALTNAIKRTASELATTRALNAAKAEAGRKAVAKRMFKDVKDKRKREKAEAAAVKRLKNKEADYRQTIKVLANKVANTFNSAHKSNNKEARDKTAKLMREMRASIQQKRRDQVLKAANITNYPWVAVTHGYAWPK